MWEYIVIGVLVLIIIGVNIYHRQLEGFISGSVDQYDIPYGLLNDRYNVPISYDDKVIDSVKINYSDYNAEVARAFQNNVYQGNQIPLKSDERPTFFEKKPLADFAGKSCRPSCCVGKLPSDQSCSHGCVCN